MNLDDWVAPRIRARDIICKCGDVCTHKTYDPLMHPRTRELLRRVGVLLSEGDYNFTITSGFRCPSHNIVSGGATDSAHVHRCALDVDFYDPGMSYDFYLAAERTGFFSGLILYPHMNMCHVDVHPNDRVARGHSYGKGESHVLRLGNRWGSPLRVFDFWNIDEKGEPPAYIVDAEERRGVIV